MKFEYNVVEDKTVIAVMWNGHLMMKTADGEVLVMPDSKAVEKLPSMREDSYGGKEKWSNFLSQYHYEFDRFFREGDKITITF